MDERARTLKVPREYEMLRMGLMKAYFLAITRDQREMDARMLRQLDSSAEVGEEVEVL